MSAKDSEINTALQPFTYEPFAPPIKAIRWDGSPESTVAVRQWLNEGPRTVSVEQLRGHYGWNVRTTPSSDTIIYALPEDECPETVIVSIMTDSHENANREWTHLAIKALVEQQTLEHDWQFLYMGADQDAVEVGSRLGVKREQSVKYSKGKSRAAMGVASANIRIYRDAKTTNINASMPLFSPAQREALDD